jgi:alanyl-tRNA synthetase
LHSTGEIGTIKILKSSKIQDGIVRIEFTAGPAADTAKGKEKTLLTDTAKILDVKPNQVPARGNELFMKWNFQKMSMPSLQGQL